MKKRVLAMVMAVVLIAASVLPAAAFSDVADEELSMKVELLRTFGFVDGYPDGSFRPNNTLTRAEFIKLTINLLGLESESALYGNYTIFGDVPGGFWATRYINLAARELELIKGYSDGTFLPNNPIKYAEAVTIVMRALGYTDADVGHRWPNGFMERAAALELTEGISRGAYDSINRGDGATLFYNALFTVAKNGTRMIDGLLGEAVENVLVVGINADGSVRLDGGTVVKSVITVDSGAVGRRIDFVTDKNERLLDYVVREQTRSVIAVDYCNSDSIVALDGLTYKIPSTVRIFANGLEEEPTSYSAIRVGLSVGDGLELVYDDEGKLDYVILLGSGSADGAKIVGMDVEASKLLAALGAPANARIYKNGAPITVAELKEYDVAVYNRATGMVNVCDFRLAGVYEFAMPNTASPSRVTMHSNRFDVSAAASASLAELKIGQQITMLFTSDGTVARAIAGGVGGNNPAGLYTGDSVEFIGGPTLAFSFSNVQAGELVRVSASGAASRLNGKNVTRDLNLKTGKLGEASLTPDCVFFERVGANSVMAPLSRDEILFDTVSADNIAFAVYDAAGRASIIVFDDLTGDRYIYGEITGRSTVEHDGYFEIERNYLKVAGAYGEKEFLYPKILLPGNGWGGIAADRDGKVVAVNTLTKLGGMTRADFVGSSALVIDGVAVPLPDDVQIYLAATKKYMTGGDVREMIADARAFGTEFEVYMDRAAADGGKVRILVVK